MYGDKMTRATSAFIANNKLLPIFVRQLLTQTNAVVPDSVAGTNFTRSSRFYSIHDLTSAAAAMFSTINAWLQAVKTVQGTIPSEFDVEYFKTALVTLLNSDHYRILAYALVFVRTSVSPFPLPWRLLTSKSAQISGISIDGTFPTRLGNRFSEHTNGRQLLQVVPSLESGHTNALHCSALYPSTCLLDVNSSCL
jgi:hypothetical protein